VQDGEDKVIFWSPRLARIRKKDFPQGLKPDLYYQPLAARDPDPGGTPVLPQPVKSRSFDGISGTVENVVYPL
jgi:hypothetical protein